MLDFSSGNDFLLQPTQYGELGGVLFYYRWNDMPLDVSVNVIVVYL